jgi:hypothetical protein
MYRIVKSKYSSYYAIHKITKFSKGETYIEADPVIKAESLEQLKLIWESVNKAFAHSVIKKDHTIIQHRVTWNESDIPFYEDISETLLEQEFKDAFRNVS